MISIIITSYNEPRTIGKSIERILANNLDCAYEILITAPDKETLDVAKKYSKKHRFIRTLKDYGKGKSAALNLAVSKARGDILVLTDGDVYIDRNSLKPLIDAFKDKTTGAISGNPVSINPKNTMFGYWAYVLTSIANETRINAQKYKKRFFCSGYLFAIRKSLFSKLPEGLLSEDGFISSRVYSKGYLIRYSENSKVYVKYPTTFRDWIIQKKRSAGGYNQIKKLTGMSLRSFGSESLGAFGLFKYLSNLSEVIWLIELFLARLYLWAVIYRDITIKKKSHKEIWKRVESTK